MLVVLQQAPEVDADEIVQPHRPQHMQGPPSGDGSSNPVKAENLILRAKLLPRLTVTPTERERLVKLDRTLGKAINDLITIVSPRSFLRRVHAQLPATERQAPTKRAGHPHRWMSRNSS